MYIYICPLIYLLSLYSYRNLAHSRMFKVTLLYTRGCIVQAALGCIPMSPVVDSHIMSGVSPLYIQYIPRLLYLDIFNVTKILICWCPWHHENKGFGI